MSTKPKTAKLGRREAVRLFHRTMKTLSEQGFNVAAVLSRYDGEDAHFSTALGLHGDEAQQDHALCDAFRELAVNWSNARHDSQLVWQDPPAKPRPKPEAKPDSKPSPRPTRKSRVKKP